MDRREWLKRVSALAAGVVSSSSLLAVFEAHAAAQAAGGAPQFFSAAQGELVAAVVEIMIPRTDTPGALDAGVPAFIDQMFGHVYAPADQARYLNALASFDQAGSQPFLKLGEAQRKAMVARLHTEALANPPGDEDTSATAFVMMTKRLAMMGFFLSQPGCTDVLQYVAVPGAYHADIPLSQAGNGKAWAEETVLTL